MILGHEIHPFWSYSAIMEGTVHVLPEIIMNVLVFFPVGFLLGFGFRCMTWRKALMIGGGISVMIEVLQFLLKKGFAETDDVIHNVLGSMMGYGIYKLVQVSRFKSHGRKSAVRV